MASDGNLSESKGSHRGSSDSGGESESERLRDELLYAKKQRPPYLCPSSAEKHKAWKKGHTKDCHVHENLSSEDHEEDIQIKLPKPIKEWGYLRHKKNLKNKEKSEKEKDKHCEQHTEKEDEEKDEPGLERSDSTVDAGVQEAQEEHLVTERQRRIEVGWSAWKQSLSRCATQRRYNRTYSSQVSSREYRAFEHFAGDRSERHTFTSVRRRDNLCQQQQKMTGRGSGHQELQQLRFARSRSPVGRQPRRGSESSKRWLLCTGEFSSNPHAEEERKPTATRSGSKAPSFAGVTSKAAFEPNSRSLKKVLSPSSEDTPTQNEVDSCQASSQQQQSYRTDPITIFSEDEETRNTDCDSKSNSSLGKYENSLSSRNESEIDASDSHNESDDAENVPSRRLRNRRRKEKYSKFESSAEETDSEPMQVEDTNCEKKAYENEPVVRSHHLDEEPKSAQSGPKSNYLSFPVFYPAISGCRSIEEYSILNRIDEGTYGIVYQAQDKRSDEVVALKLLKMKVKEGFSTRSLREINMLLKAQHCNCVTVREIVVNSNIDKIYLVMDYVEHDIKSLMEAMKKPFLVGEVKTLMEQLLSGVHHLHDNWILHRDLKTSNLLLSHKGILKIADFGLAREYGSPLKPYSPVVVTLWYRAPELLLGVKEYSTAIDMWSVGCILAEFLTLKPLFPGKGEQDQIKKIFKDLGTPNDSNWPGWSELPAVKRFSFPHHPYNNLRNRFGSNVNLSKVGLELLKRFLMYNPLQRITALVAMKHDWFKEEPRPIPTHLFPTWPAKSEKSRILKRQRLSPHPSRLEVENSTITQLGESDEEIIMRSLNIRPRDMVHGFSLKFDPKLDF